MIYDRLNNMNYSKFVIAPRWYPVKSLFRNYYLVILDRYLSKISNLAIGNLIVGLYKTAQ